MESNFAFLQYILQFVIPPIVTSGVIGFIISYLFNKRLEVFKIELQKSITEHQIKFTSLHEKRLLIIESLYAKLTELANSLKSYTDTRTVNFADESKVKVISANWLDFKDFFEKNELYFSDEITKKVKNIIDFVNHILTKLYINVIDIKLTNDIAKSSDFDAEREKEYTLDTEENIKEDDHFVNDIVPQLQLELRDEFRKLIGVI